MNKKLIALFLCATMPFSLIATAFASEDNAETDSGAIEGPYLPGTNPSVKPGVPDKPVEKPDNPGTQDPQPGDDDEPNTRPITPSNPTTPSDSDYVPSTSGTGGGGASAGNNVLLNGSQDKKEETKKEEPKKEETKPNVSYLDVPTTEWYYNAVVYVTQQGMMSGNNGLFSPNAQFTRAMMAQILYNLDGKPAVGVSAFPDVGNDWYTAAITYVSSQGLMSGYSNGNFGPNDPITREQLASTLFRYSQKKGYNTTASAEYAGFSDAAQVSDWAAQSIRWALGAGLISGKTGVAGTRLDPTGTATRAEVAQILMNFGQKVAVTTAPQTAAPAADTAANGTESTEDKEATDETKTTE